MRLAALALLLSSGCAPRDPDALAARVLPEEPIGLAVAVVKDGAVVFKKGYGYADIASKRPVDGSTVFDLASLGKQFTGAAALVLAKKGKLALGEDARRRVPELPLFDAARLITLHDLSRHISGLPERSEGAVEKMKKGLPPTPKAEVLAWLSRQQALDFPTGTAWAYSNMGYFALAVAVERAAGEPFGRVLREELFRPAGMKSAMFLERPKDVVPNRATSYCYKGSPCRWDDSLPGGANVFASLDDLIAWDAALRRGAPVSEKDLLAELEAAKLDSGRPAAYALGWGLARRNGRRVMWHDGDFIGASAYMARYVDDGVTVVLLANRGDLPLQKLGERLAELHLP